MTERLLLLDIGNSRVKWALSQAGAMFAGGGFFHGGLVDSAPLGQIQPEDKPDRILVSNVAGDAALASVRHWASEQHGCEPEQVVSAAEGWGIRNAYADPRRLGSDRWLAMIAARQQLPGHVAVVDAGSALTLDFVTADGEHLGGYILPGLQASMDCVLAGTQLTDNGHKASLASRDPGRTTAQCLHHGAMMSACLSIEGAVAELEKRLRQRVQCLLTGGDSSWLSEHLKIPHIIEPALVLKGLAIVGKGTDYTV